ncbi:restriction endonuclease [Nibrella viscosa]|uniref:restriction endonuclease n=1 Tax=Nibrella viscosa TaxID=1084524 RepID=UPI0031EA92AF
MTKISPGDFEVLVKTFLIESGVGLKDLDVQHNVKESANDGTYQIDVKATFEAFAGSLITVIVECKHYNTPIKREKVEVLYSRVKSLGAHKGILCSTSGFQQGAVDFAKAHGIALIWVIEGKFTYETRSRDRKRDKPSSWSDAPKYVGGYAYKFTETGCTTTYLQHNYMEPLAEFLFG